MNTIPTRIVSVDIKTESNEVATPVVDKPTTRPDTLGGTTYKIKPNGSSAYYITITNKDNKPYEIFISTKDMSNIAWTTALSRLISAVFRNNSHPQFLVEELMSIMEPSGGYFAKETAFSSAGYKPSVLYHIGEVLNYHISNLNPATRSTKQHPIQGKQCPNCKSNNLIKESGCDKCTSCGYSKCG